MWSGVGVGMDVAVGGGRGVGVSGGGPAGVAVDVGCGVGVGTAVGVGWGVVVATGSGFATYPTANGENWVVRAQSRMVPSSVCSSQEPTNVSQP